MSWLIRESICSVFDAVCLLPIVGYGVEYFGNKSFTDIETMRGSVGCREVVMENCKRSYVMVALPL